eukprot:3650543-Heterocapsa_arctica.AAC.1
MGLGAFDPPEKPFPGCCGAAPSEERGVLIALATNALRAPCHALALVGGCRPCPCRWIATHAARWEGLAGGSGSASC